MTAEPVTAPHSATRRRERAAWGFIAPALIAIAIFFVVPVVSAMFLSLTDFDIYALADLRNLRFVGGQNYERLLTNPLFWGAMRNTVVFAIIGVPLTIAASLGAAVILHARVVKWRPIWRVMFFAPYVTTLVATAVLWNYLLHTRYGVINWALTSIGLPAVDWLGSPATSIPAILMFVVWKTFGYNMLIFLAVLQTVPDDLYEAARIDGAGPWKSFRHVTLPAIAPTLLLVSIISVAGFFQLFAEPYVMTQGGPAQSTVTVLYFMYEEGFKWWNLGSASAVAVILFLCIFAITMVQLWVSRRLGAET
ncbi:MAG: multiple sugar transport system permease protein [Brevundimonas sp.]|jgi:multiple sugar transport system permease protein|uniref:carbohydrate ABC transporter permease n=1 Tax=Brevundimonas sp. TaxID=1871086 RepID=UPI002487016E|nr:sugar ABC transporter permease [Brevundimonas sp.]MDI1282362.1 sugar ABC transporter permease [Brevundimonas sp.]